MTRVLFLGLKIFSVGGIEQVCKNWLYALTSLEQKNKIRFRSLSMYDDIIDERYIDKSKIEVCKSNRLAFGVKAIWNAVRSDIVIIPHLNLSLFVLIAKLISPRTKVYVQVHGIEAWGNLSGLQERLLRQADAILSVSNYTKDVLLEKYPELKSKIKILPNSLDPLKSYSIHQTENESFREKIGVTQNQKLIITVGRLHHEEAYKGYDKTIEAIYQLNDDSIRFHIIGKYDTIEKQRLFEILVKYDLVGNVKLVGYTSDEDLALYYQSADLFVMPSKGEGFGLVFIDAMAHGLRVIGGNADGSVDAIYKVDNNALVNPDDIVELSRLIKNKLEQTWDLDSKLNLSNKCISLFSKEIFEINIESIIL